MPDDMVLFQICPLLLPILEFWSTHVQKQDLWTSKSFKFISWTSQVCQICSLLVAILEFWSTHVEKQQDIWTSKAFKFVSWINQKITVYGLF